MLNRLRGDARLDQPVALTARRPGCRPPWGAHGPTTPPLLALLLAHRAGLGVWLAPQVPVHTPAGPAVGQWVSNPCAGLRHRGVGVPRALELSAAQVVEACAARVRPEDGFRDHHPRRGMNACRAWIKAPGLCTFQVHMLALRRRPCRLEHTWGAGHG